MLFLLIFFPLIKFVVDNLKQREDAKCFIKKIHNKVRSLIQVLRPDDFKIVVVIKL